MYYVRQAPLFFLGGGVGLVGVWQSTGPLFLFDYVAPLLLLLLVGYRGWLYRRLPFRCSSFLGRGGGARGGGRGGVTDDRIFLLVKTVMEFCYWSKSLGCRLYIWRYFIQCIRVTFNMDFFFSHQKWKFSLECVDQWMTSSHFQISVFFPPMKNLLEFRWPMGKVRRFRLFLSTNPTSPSLLLT